MMYITYNLNTSCFQIYIPPATLYPVALVASDLVESFTPDNAKHLPDKYPTIDERISYLNSIHETDQFTYFGPYSNLSEFELEHPELYI